MSVDHSIAQLCAALGLRTSGYYAWVQAAPSVRQQQDAALLGQIQAVHAQHQGRYGAPRIQHALAREGRRHGTKRIARLMKQAGLRGLCPKRFVPRTTDSAHDQPIAPNRLAQAPAPMGPNQVWVSDLTYVATQQGWLYVAVILDLWSRRVVGWMPVIVVFARHALGAPLVRRTTRVLLPAQTIAQRGPWHMSVEPVAPTRRKWHSRQ